MRLMERLFVETVAGEVGEVDRGSLDQEAAVRAAGPVLEE